MLVKRGMRIDRVHNEDPREMRYMSKKQVFSEPGTQTHRCLRNITLPSVVSRASPFCATQNSSIPTISPLCPPTHIFFYSTVLCKIIQERTPHWLPSTFFCSRVCKVKKKNCNFFLANERTHQINDKLAIRINEKSGVSEVNK